MIVTALVQFQSIGGSPDVSSSSGRLHTDNLQLSPVHRFSARPTAKVSKFLWPGVRRFRGHWNRTLEIVTIPRPGPHSLIPLEEFDGRLGSGIGLFPP